MPQRRCRVCRQVLSKDKLLRWTLNEGVLVPDEKQTRPGRGYYSCSERCNAIMPKTAKAKQRS